MDLTDALAAAERNVLAAIQRCIALPGATRRELDALNEQLESLRAALRAAPTDARRLEDHGIRRAHLLRYRQERLHVMTKLSKHSWLRQRIAGLFLVASSGRGRKEGFRIGLVAEAHNGSEPNSGKVSGHNRCTLGSGISRTEACGAPTRTRARLIDGEF